MFNVRPDKFWPWIRFEPPSDDPSGFRIAADGSIGTDGSGFGLLGHNPGADTPAPAGISLGHTNHFADGNSNPFGSIVRHASDFGLISSIGRRPSPPYAISLLFPRLTEPQGVWAGPQGNDRELEVPTDTTLLGFDVMPPDDPPGFRIAADNSGQNGSPSDLLTSFGYDPGADVVPPAGIGSHAALRPAEDHRSPFEFLDRRHLNNNPIPSFDGGPLSPHAASFLFPRMAMSQFTWPSQQDDGEFDAGPDGSLPGFHLQPPADAPPTRGALPDDLGLSSFGYHPQTDATPSIDVNSADGIRPVENAIYPTTYPAYDSTYFPAPPRDPVQEALDQIARIYRIDWQGSSNSPTMLRLGRSASGSTTAVSDAFDPGHIVPTTNPVRPPPSPPPPGPRHNNGPPLESTSPSRTQPSRTGPIQGAPAASQPTDNSTAAAGAAAAANAVATNQQNAPAPIDPEADEKLDIWQKMVSSRGQQAPGSQYLGAGGINTWVGVRLNPKLPEPAAGYYYRPSLRHLRNGYRGELELANRIVTTLPNEIVIHYGMPAGRQGPDVISISREGTISVWDSKWRSGQRSIGPGQGAHQAERSLNALYWEILKQIRLAVRSGHLPPDVGVLAMKNITARKFDIYTIGTGNAHSGVAQSVRKGVPTDFRRP